MRKLILIILLVFGGLANANPPGTFNPLLLNACSQRGNDANTISLLHFDGNFTDTNASSTSTTWTAGGTLATNTTSFTVPKFGSASAKNAASGSLTAPDSAALRPGAGDFTIDFWVYYNAGSAAYSLYDKGATAANGLLLRTDGGVSEKIQLWTNSAVFLTETTGSAAGGWHHKAIVRSSGTFTIYDDGTANGSVANGTNFNLTNNIGIIGRNGGTEPLNGNMDEYRFSNIARWTSNFTPPTQAYCP